MLKVIISSVGGGGDGAGGRVWFEPLDSRNTQSYSHGQSPLGVRGVTPRCRSAGETGPGLGVKGVTLG